MTRRDLDEPRIAIVVRVVHALMAHPERNERLAGVCMEALIHTKPDAFDGWPDDEVLAVLARFGQHCPEAQLNMMVHVAEALAQRWLPTEDDVSPS